MEDRQPGLSDVIARHVAKTPYEALPAATLAAAARILLDASGVIYAASGTSADIAPFIALAQHQAQGHSRILGTGLTSAAPFAAFANGAMAHALDYEDAFDPAPSHPNAATIPALLALAQAGPPIGGRDLLAAVAIGCDLVCRLGLSLTRPMEAGGWYPPPILGALGAAAACARLLRLDARQTRDALSIMLCQTAMPGEIKYSPATVLRAVREAFPAQAAVTAVLLARDGVAGFETPLEGKAGFFRLFAESQYDPAVLLDGLGERYWTEQLSFKAWPACRGTHAFIEMAMDLARAHGFGWQDVARITLHTDRVHAMLVQPLDRKRAPQVAIDAKFSIPFTVATALVRGHVTLDDFDAAALGDPDILALAQRIDVAAVETPRWRIGSGGAMTLALRDGRVFEAELTEPLGCPERPLTTETLVAKFVDCAGRAAQPIAPGAAAAMAQRILQIADAQDAGALFV